MVLLDLLIPQVLSVTRCAASACRVSYHMIGHPASCTKDDIIKSGKKKIKDLDADTIDADINPKFKLLHIFVQTSSRGNDFLKICFSSQNHF